VASGQPAPCLTVGRLGEVGECRGWSVGFWGGGGAARAAREEEQRGEPPTHRVLVPVPLRRVRPRVACGIHLAEWVRRFAPACVANFELKRVAGVVPLCTLAPRKDVRTGRARAVCVEAATVSSDGKSPIDPMGTCSRCSADRPCARRGGKWPDRSLHVYAGLLANVSARTGPRACALFF
jgi:hypothetical protein